MVAITVAERRLAIPENVKVEVEGRKVKVTGQKGSLVKDLSHMPVKISIENGTIVVSAVWPRKRETSMVGTALSKIKSMLTGVTEGYTYKLKVVYAHFPVTVKVLKADRKVLIENFGGEKVARSAEIFGDVEVSVAGDDVLVKGIELESVSQTAANIEATAGIKGKDLRVFLDGIYVYEKSVGM